MTLMRQHVVRLARNTHALHGCYRRMCTLALEPCSPDAPQSAMVARPGLSPDMKGWQGESIQAGQRWTP
jgi:hypothetical protein